MLSSIGLEPLVFLQPMVYFGFQVFVSASLLFLLCLPTGVLVVFGLCGLLSILNSKYPYTYGVFWIPGVFAASLLFLLCLPGVLSSFLSDLVVFYRCLTANTPTTYGVFWFLGFFCCCFSSLPGAFTWCFFVFFSDLCCPLSVLNRQYP